MAAWLRRLSLAVTTQLERGQQQHRQLGECTDNNALTLYALCTGSAIGSSPCPHRLLPALSTQPSERSVVTCAIRTHPTARLDSLAPAQTSSPVQPHS